MCVRARVHGCVCVCRPSSSPLTTRESTVRASTSRARRRTRAGARGARARQRPGEDPSVAAGGRKTRRGRSASRGTRQPTAPTPLRSPNASANASPTQRGATPSARARASRAALPQRVRAEEKLGPKRPITGWTTGTHKARAHTRARARTHTHAHTARTHYARAPTGCTATVKLPDFAWTDWARAQARRTHARTHTRPQTLAHAGPHARMHTRAGTLLRTLGACVRVQTERVLDSMDIDYMRMIDEVHPPARPTRAPAPAHPPAHAHVYAHAPAHVCVCARTARALTESHTHTRTHTHTGRRRALQDLGVGPLAERGPIGPAPHQARHLPVPHAIAVRDTLARWSERERERASARARERERARGARASLYCLVGQYPRKQRAPPWPAVSTRSLATAPLRNHERMRRIRDLCAWVRCAFVTNRGGPIVGIETLALQVVEAAVGPVESVHHARSARA